MNITGYSLKSNCIEHLSRAADKKMSAIQWVSLTVTNEKRYKKNTANIPDADGICFIGEGAADGGFLVDIRLSKLMSIPVLRQVAGTLYSSSTSLTHSFLPPPTSTWMADFPVNLDSVITTRFCSATCSVDWFYFISCVYTCSPFVCEFGSLFLVSYGLRLDYSI